MLAYHHSPRLVVQTAICDNLILCLPECNWLSVTVHTKARKQHEDKEAVLLNT